MGRPRSGRNYRALYKEHYNIDFGDDMVVHHIDFNRSNNNIDNLLLMPKKLHSSYHWMISMLDGTGTGHISADLQLGSLMVPIHYPQWLRKMADVLDEVEPWVKLKIEMDMFPQEIKEKIHPHFIDGTFLSESRKGRR